MKKWQYVNLYSTEPVKRVFTSLIIDFVTPHAVLEKELEPQERIAFIYEDISWEHTLAGTNAMSKWQDRVQ
ncbi:hypothetical protein BT09F27_39250 [Escherichia coli]